MDAKLIKFQHKIWDFYTVKKREFPWRNTTDFYKILVSEIMLQQTQTGRVVDKYLSFIKRFPNFKSLANAPQSEVLKHWQGLGYNRRALYVKRAAEILTSLGVDSSHTRGENILTPKEISPDFLQTLPGVGKNTAGAIYVFTTNKPHVFIETNIRRVFIHEFFTDQDKVSDPSIILLISQTLPRSNFRDWYYALMDYGAHLAKTDTNPNRRSKHYAKQSTFEGSLRQARGKILRKLLDGSLPIAILSKEFDDHEKFDKALTQLISEGFIVKEKSNIRIK